MTASLPALAIILIVFQLGDAVACAIPIKFIDGELTRLGCSARVRKLIPVVKVASAMGLAAGLWFAPLGLLTSFAIVDYFIVAIWYHMRARDKPAQFAAPVLLGTFAAVVGVLCYLPAL